MQGMFKRNIGFGRSCTEENVEVSIEEITQAAHGSEQVL